MSIEAQTWAWAQPVGNPSDKLVLVALGDNAGIDGSNAFPSLDTLAVKTGLARRTVWASLRRLVVAGFIEQTAKPRQHKPAVYRLCLDRVATPAPLRAPSKATAAPVQKLHPCNTEHPEVQMTASRGATVAPKPKENLQEPSTNTLSAKRGTRIPDPFVITDDMRSWAINAGFVGNLDGETEQFCDHHRGKGTVGKDWPATWRTWIRNAIKWAKPAARNGQPPPSNFDQHRALADQLRNQQPAIGGSR